MSEKQWLNLVHFKSYCDNTAVAHVDLNALKDIMNELSQSHNTPVPQTAEWIYNAQGECFCSNCKIRPAPIYPTPYCPNCGHYMRNPKN